MPRFRDAFGITGFGLGTIVFGGIAVLVAVFVIGGIAISRLVNHHNCVNFAHQTGRETKFVVYNFASGGECLTKTPDGKWIPISGLREFGERP